MTWRNSIDKIPLYPEKTGGNKTRHNKFGGTRKRCKNGTRKNPKTKKCVKNKTKKNNKPHFRIGVDFGGVLAKHKRGEENQDKIEEHKNTQIDMPGAIENLKKLKKNGHQLYIVSFCGRKRALEGMKEVEASGLNDVFTEQIYIKNPYEKGRVLLNFGCNFMIDDRIDLLNRIRFQFPEIVTIWFGQKKDACKNQNIQHICAEDWDEVYNIISKHKQFHVPKLERHYQKFLAIKPPKEEDKKEEDKKNKIFISLSYYKYLKRCF
jgi:hypothetical protein